MIEFNHSWLSLKKQKKCYERHKHFIKEIYDMYWETMNIIQPKLINGTIHREVIVKFRWQAKEIIKNFNLKSTQELLFLIGQDSRTNLDLPISRRNQNR